MGYPSVRGIWFSVDIVLLAVATAVIAVFLMRNGHGAEEARVVIKAKTVMARAFRLRLPEEPGSALLYLRDDGPVSLTFHSSSGWFFSLQSDPQRRQDITFDREGRPGHESSLHVDASGSPWLAVADLETSMNLSLSAVRGAPSLNMGRAAAASIIVAGAGPNITFPAIVFLRTGTKSVRMSIGSSDEVTNLSLLGKDDGLKGQLGLDGVALPELSLYHGKLPPVVQVRLDPMHIPFIRLHDSQAGTTRTLR